MRKFSRSLAFISAFTFAAACGDDPEPPPTTTAPKITSTAVLTAKEGVAYSYMIVATGQPSPTVAATNKPAWLTLEGRLLSGTPARADVGTHMVTLTASNGVLPVATQTFTVTVEAAETQTAPMITSTAPTTAAVGLGYSYAIVATGDPAPTITATSEGGGALPAWLTFNATTNTLSGTPGMGDVGDAAIVVTAANGVSPDATQSFSIAVASTGVAPAFTSTPVTVANEGQAYSYTPAASGTPAATITAGTLPAWLTFAGGVLSGTPAAGDVGDHAITFTAANGVSPDATQTFTITVAAIPTVAPSFTSVAPLNALVGNAYSYTPVATGTPVPSISATTLPAWLTFDSATGVLSGTPGFMNIGSNAVELTADNGVAPNAVQRFTIEVGSTAVAPAFTSTPITVATEGSLYSYTAAASGTPSPTITATQIPAWLTFDSATNVLSGTPTAADGGAHTIILTADNALTAAVTQTFTINVGLLGIAPSFTSTPVTDVLEGSAYSYTVTASGQPAPVLSATVLPPWLIFDAASGLLSGTPGPGDVGPNLVEITAANGVPPAAIQSFTITVEGLPSAPSITSTPVTAALENVAYSYTIAVTGTPAPVLTVTGAAGGPLPSWLSYNATTRVLSGTPLTANIGDAAIEISADNGIAPAATQNFTITVAAFTAPPAITSVAVTTVQAGAAYSYQVTATGSPIPTITASGLPAWLTIAGGRISGTPSDSDVGTTAPITVTAANGISPDATQTFTITVAPLGTIAILNNPYSQNFDAAATPAGWAVTANQWQFGAATTGANTVGPPSLYDGNLAATLLTGNYPASANWVMRTPTFDFTGVAVPTLRFATWHNFERSTTGPAFTAYDGGNIKISTDGGATFVQLAANSVTPAYSGPLDPANTMAGQQAWSGILSNWQIYQADLTASLAGQPLNQVVLRFDFGSDTSVQRPGWYVDSVRVADAAALRTAPLIVSAAPTALNLVAGLPFTYNTVATGSAPLVFSATLVGGAPLPAWLTIDAATGVLSGTPSNADAGAVPVLITVSNGERPNATLSFTLNVSATNAIALYTFEGDVRTASVVAANITATEINNRLSTTTFVAGNPGRAINSNGWLDAVDPNYYEFTVTPASGQQVRLTTLAFDHYRSATGPQNYSVSLIRGTTNTVLTNGTGTIPNGTTWTPTPITLTAAESGPYFSPVTVRISAWGASASGGTLRLDNVRLTGALSARDNLAPSITSTPPSTATLGVPYSYVVTTEGWPAPTVTVTGLPSWLTYTSATRTIAGTPNGLSVGVSPTITVTAANTTTPNAVQTFTITVQPPPSTPIVNGTPMVQSFGTAAPAGWSSNGGWQFGIPTVGANTVGPPTVFSGEVAATRIAGNYDNSVYWSMVTEPLDLTGVTNPVLTFVHWYNFERSTLSPTFTCYDGANIKISTNGGATFTQLAPTSVFPAYTCALSANAVGMGGQQGWSGILGDWTTVAIDLGANLASAPLNQVVIRFDMGADGSTTRPGWYVDNVRIGASADLATAPAITSTPRRSVREGVAYSYTVVATGILGPSITVTNDVGGPLPAWLTFNAATGVLGGTPTAADVGVHNINVTATNATGSVTQSIALRVFPTGATPVFSDGFEMGVGAWVLGFNVGTAGEWQIGTPTVVGPTSCYAGTQCAGTNLSGNYAAEVRLSYLQTPVVDLTGIPQPALRFRQWYRTESAVDGANLKISTDGGVTWAPITLTSVVPAYTGILNAGSPLAGQRAWSGTAASWAVVNVDLAPDLVGLPVNQVAIRYEFGQNEAVVDAGWYIDAVNIGDFVTLP